MYKMTLVWKLLSVTHSGFGSESNILKSWKGKQYELKLNSPRIGSIQHTLIFKISVHNNFITCTK